MDNLLQGLLGHLDDNAVGQIAQQLGVDQQTAQQGVQAALPVLLGALAHNSQTPEGAEALSSALSNDHDGNVLGDVAGTIANYQNGPGAAILGHVLGGQGDAIGNLVGQQLGGANGGALLQMLAPIMMGYLGQQKQQNGLDAAGIAGMLLGGQQQQAPQASGLLGMAAQLLDQNHNGSAVDDLMGMAARFLKR